MNRLAQPGGPSASANALLHDEASTPYAFERVQRDSGGSEVARLEAQNLLLEKADPLAQLPPTPPDGAILDVGSGTGFWSLRLAARIPQGRLTCLDRSGELLALASKRLEGATALPPTFLRQDLRAVDLPERAFDLIFSCVTLAHVQELEETLLQLLPALKPGGWLACFEPIQQAWHFGDAQPECPNVWYLLDRVMEEAQARGTDLSVALKLAHHLERLGLADTVLRDFGCALHGEDATDCLRKVMLPLARTYLQNVLAPEDLERRLAAAAREAGQPHLWVDFRRAVVLARRPA